MGISVTFDTKKAINDLNLKVRDEIKYRLTMALREGFQTLMLYTPVWSARTIANWKFGIGDRPDDYTPWYDSVPYQKWFRDAPDIAGAQMNSYSSLLDALKDIDNSKDATRLVVWVVNNIEYDDGEEIDALEFGEIGRTQPLMATRAFQEIDRVLGIAKP